MKTYRLIIMIFATSLASLEAQEKLLSVTEKYYDFLALDGYLERPYLNYRTLSDSDWSMAKQDENIWASANLGTRIALGTDLQFRVYGPELFASYNSAAPYGQNDGVLWQGKGLNSSFSSGVRLEGYGIELTIKPVVSFSQNQAFTLMPSAYESEYGYIWGYGQNKGIDAPQRFGEDPVFRSSWGDSEIRYTWNTMTIGFGTQLPWLGPGHINSLLHSNNASPYPKVDVGLRKTKITVLDWYAGDVEARLWCGYLSESSYFDTDQSNDHNMLSGLSLSYAPSFLPGLLVSATRVYLASWKPESLETLTSLLLFNFNSNGGMDSWDQRPGLEFTYLLPAVGAEVYGEIGLNDNPGPTLDAYIRNFSHTIAYSGGLRKSVIINQSKEIRGELLFEWSTLEMTPIYSQFLWTNSFYMHHLVTQGYSNEGQWLGAGTGTGGNSQFLGFKVYYPRGYSGFNLHRYNPDNDFLVRFTTPSPGYPLDDVYDYNFKAVISLEADSLFLVTPNIQLSASASYFAIHDGEYNGGWRGSTVTHGFRLTLAETINF